MLDVRPGRAAEPAAGPNSQPTGAAEDTGWQLRLAIAVVGTGVLLLAAAAFVLAYPAIHALARTAGVDRPAAWLLPLMLDVALVTAWVSVMSVLGRWSWITGYAWLSLLVVLAAAAATDAAAAGHVRIAAQTTAVTIAVMPSVLLLIGLGLLLAVLHGPPQRPAVSAADVAPDLEAEEPTVVLFPPVRF